MNRPIAYAVLILLLPAPGCFIPRSARTVTPVPTTRPTLAEMRRGFQDQELITSRTFGFIFNAGDPPRILWRDPDQIRRLGGDPANLRVRWFDAQLREATVPDHPGRWGVWIDGTASNGTPLRRAMTLYCRPPGFLVYTAPDFAPPLPYQPGPIAREVWEEHRDEIAQTTGSMLMRGLNDSEAGAVLIAGLSESAPLNRPPISTDSAVARNEDFHLALKLKLEKLETLVHPLDPPARLRSDRATPVLHDGPASQAHVLSGARERIESLCEAWADDSGEPFVTLVARRGVIVTHRAFGRDAATGKPIDLDYRCAVFSITKTITSILFSQFVQQRRLDWDDPISGVFPSFSPNDPAHVPTFRQCFTHMSGLSGHGDWGGVCNPHLENVFLNGIDANEVGRKYNYSGNGFELAAKAMEIISGKSWRHVYREHLFEPLGMSDVPMDNASSGARLTARDLGILAQWLANRGAYGEVRYISTETFEQMLPQPLAQRYPGVAEVEGIGMHWMNEKGPDGKTLFGEHTIGHGSLTSCILRVDLDHDLVMVQVRRQAGARYGEWAARFFQTIAAALTDS